MKTSFKSRKITFRLIIFFSSINHLFFPLIWNGVFQNSLKTLGKYALFWLKNLWENALKPKAIIVAKESVELVKDLLKENKGNIQKIVSKQS